MSDRKSPDISPTKLDHTRTKGFKAPGDSRFRRLARKMGITRRADSAELSNALLTQDLADTQIDLQQEATQRKQAEYDAAHDQLTGFLKRKQFQLLFEKDMARVNRRKHEKKPQGRLSLLISDTDDFGIVNKTYGEHIGDEVLKKSASQVRENTRESDIVGRWGGEEFTYSLLQEGSIIANILHPAERIRRLLNVIIPVGDKEVNSHASMGTTDYVPGESFEEVFERADMAMRMAKLLGKNRTVVATKQDDKIILRDLHTKTTYEYKKENGIEYLTDIIYSTTFKAIINPDNGKPHLVELEEAA